MTNGSIIDVFRRGNMRSNCRRQFSARPWMGPCAASHHQCGRRAAGG